ncbi:MAG: 3-dehydroquinate synthase [Clostridia bacterium]|nr:3-dehydroquinate synthase [Clostridia bacterium]
MNSFVIETDDKTKSEIFIENGVFSRIEEKADFVFTDTNVYALYKNQIAERFPNVPVFAMPAGEEHKTKETLFSLLAEMKRAELTRGNTLVCLGGGVVGDIGGLAAALYMRGITCIQIPTTLLSQVDSSVGGKTAIDFEGVKNMIGVFSQPKKVFVDSNFLKTLPAREIRCGLGEIVKHGALQEELFEILNTHRGRLFDLDFLSEIIPKNIAIKADVVRRDANEKGLRKCLNLGHTTAHAFELSDKKLSHGEYVLIGILFEAEIAKRLIKEADEKYLDELKEIARLVLGGVPKLCKASEAARFARLDKKNRERGKVSLTVPAARGKYEFLEIPYGEYAELIEEIGEKLC